MFDKLQSFVAKCPSVGGNKPFRVTMDGKPWASFNTLEEAEVAAKMWNTPSLAERKAKQTTRKYSFCVEY